MLMETEIQRNQPDYRPKSYSKKFDGFILPEPNSGCWLWNGGGDEIGGYWRIVHKGKRVMVHRIAYERYRGPIPSGLFVCHTCDVRCCVNPDHLFLGTKAENNADRHRKGRTLRGADNGKTKLSPEQVLAIRASTDTERALGHKYGVAHCTVGSIRRRTTWTHLPEIE
jgi:hypothetical protein